MEDFFFSPYPSSSSFGHRAVASPFDYLSPHSHHYSQPHPYPHHRHSPANSTAIFPANSPVNFPSRYPANYHANFPERYPANYPESHTENYQERHPAGYTVKLPERAPARPRVVSIPVRDNPVCSKVLEEEKRRRQREREEAAVTRIQSVARGFLVRKNMRIVRRIEGEAEEIAKRIAVAEDRIRKEEKERIRVNEMLMGLLFRLDEVRGVREYRRKVIRRVIGLQERVDWISSLGSDNVLDESEGSGEKGDSDVVFGKNGYVDVSVNMEFGDSHEEKTDDAEISVEESNSEVVRDENEESSKGLQIEEDLIGHGEEGGALDVSLGEKKETDFENSVKENNTDENCVRKEPLDAKFGEVCEGLNAGAEDSVANAVLEEMCEGNEEELSLENKQDAGQSEIQNGNGEEQQMKEESDSSSSAAEDKPVNDEMDMNEPNPVAEPAEEVVVDKEDQIVECVDQIVDVDRPKLEDGDASKGNSEMKAVMEKVMAESERLQKLVAALCERSAQQCSLMAGLMERVDHLEQMVQKMDKKKKKRHASNVISSSADKKCSQRK